MSELSDLWRDDGGAVWLVWVVGEIFLVIIFGRPEFVERGDLGDNRSVINALGGDLGDGLVGDALLFVRMIKDRGAVGRTDVAALAV